MLRAHTGHPPSLLDTTPPNRRFRCRPDAVARTVLQKELPVDPRASEHPTKYYPVATSAFQRDKQGQRWQWGQQLNRIPDRRVPPEYQPEDLPRAPELPECTTLVSRPNGSRRRRQSGQAPSDHKLIGPSPI